MCHFEYTTYTLPDILQFASDMSDTEFQFSDNIRRILRRSVFALSFCLIENDKIPPNLNARAGNLIELFFIKLKIDFFFSRLGKIVPCNGINMAKKCACIVDHDHPYDPFAAGLLVSMCPKNDQSISKYVNE